MKKNLKLFYKFFSYLYTQISPPPCPHGLILICVVEQLSEDRLEKILLRIKEEDLSIYKLKVI